MDDLSVSSMDGFCEDFEPRDSRHVCSSIVDLPRAVPLVEPSFVWGSLDGYSCVSLINECYASAVHWKPNLFYIPFGKIGEAFVKELTRLFGAYADASALESVAFKAAFLMPLLVLQKTSRKLKTKEMNCHIERRLNLWKDGLFQDLVSECITIQDRFSSRSSNNDNTRSFNFFMSEGKVKSALDLLSDTSSGKRLSLDHPADPNILSGRLVRDVLIDKHPPPGKINPSSILLNNDLLTSPDHFPHSVIYDDINGDLIKRIALQCRGAAGPSGIDAAGWRRMCSSFKGVSSDLCHALARVARRLCCEFVDPGGLSAFVTCRLIALGKNPGVRPIGIGEVCRRIISKAILKIVGNDVLEAAGPLQLCAGQDGGCEAVVHSIRQIFAESDSEALLLVDAENAFNSLNREVALRNVLHLCPSLGRVLVNTYRDPVNLFVDGEVFKSAEGTTQGDLLAMAMYAICIVPLINRMSEVNATDHVWYADECSAIGSLVGVRQWWSCL